VKKIIKCVVIGVIELNCLGEMCPIPMIKAITEYNNMKPNDQLLIITDHSCTQRSLDDYFKNRKCKINTHEVINGVWEVLIIKF